MMRKIDVDVESKNGHILEECRKFVEQIRHTGQGYTIMPASLQLTLHTLLVVVIALACYTVRLCLNRATSPVHVNERKINESVRNVGRYCTNTTTLARFTCNPVDTSTRVCICVCLPPIHVHTAN